MIRRCLLVLALASAFLVLFPGCDLARSVEPQNFMICEEPAIVRDALGRLGESESGRGLTPAGILLQLYTARDGSTWTLIMTYPGKETCVLARGENWETTINSEGSL